jgi:hypothetical protein
MKSNRRHPSASTFRLMAEGTRVVVVGGAPPVTGVITRVRAETYHKSYEVTCDDGAVIYASGYELAREGDAMQTPQGARPQS